MIARALQWLCDLDGVRPGATQALELQWRAPIARWLALTLVAALAILLTWLYLRHRPIAGRRIVLAVMRACLFAVLLAIACQPMLVFQRDRVEPASVQILLDGSASMQTREPYSDAQLGERMRTAAGLGMNGDLSSQSRIDLARRALLHDGAAPLQALSANNDVSLASFGTTSEPLGTIHAGAHASGAKEAMGAWQAIAPETHLLSALASTLSEESRLAAIVVVSDGRAVDASGLAGVIEAARDRQVKIYTVPVGSPESRCDLAIGPLTVDENVFADDLFTVRAAVSASGVDAPGEASVELRADSDDAPLAAKTISLDPQTLYVPVELTAGPLPVGRHRVRLSITADQLDGDPANNTSATDMEVRGDTIRVLYVEDRPRYEYRYIKNALLREPSIRLSCLLLDADLGFAQEGTDPIRRFPETPEELDRFDVVLFGDVDPHGLWLTGAQADMLVDFVSRRGGGFGLIAGQHSAPASFRGTTLERLLPVRFDDNTDHTRQTITAVFHPKLTPEGAASRVVRFDKVRSTSREIFDSLPGIYWFAPTSGPAPGAEVLVEHPTQRCGTGHAPIVAVGRCGAGATFFQATDDTWRWRRHTGELVFDTYWVQVVRSLTPARAANEDRRVAIQADRPTCRYGDAVTVRVKALDALALTNLGTKMTMSVVDGDGLTVQRFDLDLLSATSATYEGSFVPRSAGVLQLRPDGLTPPPGMRPASAQLRVERSGAETRDVEPDYELLRRLADGTGGKLVPLDGMQAAFAGIEDRGLHIPDDVAEPIWDTRAAVMLVTVLLAGEWTLRRLSGLL